MPPPFTLLACATKPEWSLFKKNLSFKKRADLNIPVYEHSPHLWLIQVGMGPERAYTSLATFLDQAHLPQAVIHFGLSGALIPTLALGDLLIPTQITEATSQESILLQPSQNPWEPLISQLKLSFKKGFFVTTNKVLATPSQKIEAAKKFQAMAVDMESFALAKICHRRQIPYLPIRAVFDTLEHDLTTLSQAQTINTQGNLQPLHLMKSLVTQPQLWQQLPQFQKMAAKANHHLWITIREFLNDQLNQNFL